MTIEELITKLKDIEDKSHQIIVRNSDELYVSSLIDVNTDGDIIID